MPRLERAARWLHLELVSIDISEHPTLEDEYHLRIPVVLGSGNRVLAEGQIGMAAAWRAAVRARI
jgi:hypothetical protein